MSHSIEGVDERLGGEVELHQEISPSDDYISTIVIRSQPDLAITNEIMLRIHMSSSFRENGGAKVHIERKLLKYFPPPMIIENEDSSEVQVKIPWMCKLRYPLSVWFFALRSLLRKERIEPWRVSVLVPEDFWCLSNNEPKYLSSRSISSSASALNLIIGVGRNRGRRPYMEDFDILFENMKIDDRLYIAVFGVLDGHGGVDCAQYVSEELPSAIVRCLRQPSQSCAEALFNSFLTTDVEFIASNARGSNAGSTANVALYDKFSNTCYIANTGDTRAVLSRNSIAINLSFDRKATDPEEIARIVQAGGFVINGRVLGSLAVSRAFGDYQLKTNQNKGCVIVNPEITSFQPRADDEFMIIATDGLWDVMDSQTAVDEVQMALDREKVSNTISNEEVRSQLQRIADQLAQKAILELHSADNVTVMIVLFQAVNKVKFTVSGGEESMNNPLPYSFISNTIEDKDLLNPLTKNNKKESLLVGKIPLSSSLTRGASDKVNPNFTTVKIVDKKDKDKDEDTDDEFWKSLVDDSMFITNEVSNSFKDFNKKPPPSSGSGPGAGGGGGFGYNYDK